MLLNNNYTFGTKPSNPNEGDMYYDMTTGRNNMFAGGKWYEIKASFAKNIERKEKIKAILK